MTPHVLVNFAITADGHLANPDGSQLAISNEEDKRVVHELRNAHDAILVGINTVLADDPKLTVKEKYVASPQHPIRIVLDSNGRTPKDSIVLDGQTRTIIATNESCSQTFEKAEIIRCGAKQVNIETLLSRLSDMGIQTLMVEGGGQIIASFINAGLVDEMRVFVAPIESKGGPLLADADINAHLQIKKIERLGSGYVVKYKRK